MTEHHPITNRDSHQGALTDAGATAPHAHPAGTGGPAESERGRRCPVCGTSFTPSPRKPDHTYCCERCRATAWRHRRRDAARRVAELTAGLTGERATASSTTSNTTTDANHMTHDVTNDVGTNNVGENEDCTEVNAVQHCPHCRQPIALITLIVTPAAAHVTVPTLPPIPTRRGRS